MVNAPSAANRVRSDAVSVLIPRSLLVFEGGDALDFLHRMSTNDVRALQDGAAVRTVVVNEKGRVIDVVTVSKDSEHTILLGSPGSAAELAKWFERFIIMEDIRINVALEYPGLPAVYGPNAHDIAGMEIPPFRWVREDLGRIPGYVAVPAHPRPDEADPAVPPVIDTIERIGSAELETVRIEELVPTLGRELGPEVNALEAGLKPFVSFSKGCYLGQEVIARLDTYRKLRTILALFVIDADMPTPGLLLQGDLEAGRITSTAFSPMRGRWIGLGFRQIRAGNPVSVDFRLDQGVEAPSAPCACVSMLPPGYEGYEIG